LGHKPNPMNKTKQKKKHKSDPKDIIVQSKQGLKKKKCTKHATPVQSSEFVYRPEIKLQKNSDAQLYTSRNNEFKQT